MDGANDDSSRPHVKTRGIDVFWDAEDGYRLYDDDEEDEVIGKIPEEALDVVFKEEYLLAAQRNFRSPSPTNQTITVPIEVEVEEEEEEEVGVSAAGEEKEKKKEKKKKKKKKIVKKDVLIREYVVMLATTMTVQLEEDIARDQLKNMKV